MSERSTTGGLLSYLRRPAGRLRDLPIWSKLVLIMIVPTIATIAVGINGLVGHLQAAKDAERARALTSLIDVSGELAQNLQEERAAAVMVLGNRDPKARAERMSAYSKAQGAVEQSRRPYNREQATLSDLPTSFATLLRDIDKNLQELPATRSQVANLNLQLSDAIRNYTTLLDELLNIRDSSIQLAGDNDLGERMRATTALARLKEAHQSERVVGLQALAMGDMTTELQRAYIRTKTSQDQAEQQFVSVASDSERKLLQDRVAGSDRRLAERYRGVMDSKGPGSMSDLGFNAVQWDTALGTQAALLWEVEKQLDGVAADRATELYDAVIRRLFVETSLLLIAVLIAFLFAWLVARSMARSLRELRHGALAVAQHGLPHAVARLRDPQVSTSGSAQQLAAQIAEPLPVRSKDEFGQVTEAFNQVHLEAVRTAAEQAQLRSSVSTMFVNLARRSQILVDRLIGHLDRLERGEEDPDRLAELFQLDHLATRMRRNDENLLVLAGADSTRVQREPAALIDVLRAAQSEVEHYTRIEFGVVDRDIEVVAQAVNDLVHLVAELFDNATAFSPPDSHVVVEARRVGDRAVLYVEDRGIGVSPDQLADLNERLATPPVVDVTVSRMMGLVVVARLASRHGVKVELRPAAERGTIADVTLPTEILVPRALVGRGPGAGLPAGSSSLVPAPPAAGHSPLALESGLAPASGGPGGAPADGFGRPFEPAAPGLNGGSFSGFTPVSSPPANGPGGPAVNGPGVKGPGAGGPGANGPSRPLPAWSDLTGAAGTNGGGATGTDGTATGPGGEALPQRRSGDHWAVDGEVSGPPAGIPRQVPTSPEVGANGAPANGAPRPGGFAERLSSRPGGPGGPLAPRPGGAVPPSANPPVVPPAAAPPMVPPVASAPPAVSVPPVVSAPPVGSGSPAGPAAPPAWPPVAPEREATPPAPPERVAAALDMTAELPRVRPDELAAPATPYVPPAQAQRQRFADETMELPIFRELESAWFRTRRSASPPGAPGGSTTIAPSAPAGAPSAPTGPVEEKFAPPAMPQVGPMGGAGEIPAPAPVPAPAVKPPAPPVLSPPPPPIEAIRPSWETAADDGWRAAQALAEIDIDETTTAGLPKRVPMAQLVPGGVEKPVAAVQRRTPEGVRGLLSAYHRGVQRGRTQPKDEHSPSVGTATDPGPTPAGPDSVQAGKEHEA
ncbi:sensor histidine kinase [Rhizomonospora bruguierae]|uniref:sensor histidine kinase n=1 Tax=Rhizomonospora bruguierae TaxID=1581705 RepID=UPI001BCBA0BF|nr:sensor histidine kinase [Micromonospora sp. NBRC 107566]